MIQQEALQIFITAKAQLVETLEKAFSVTSKLWNALPSEACLASSLPPFLGLIRAFVFRRNFNLRDLFCTGFMLLLVLIFCVNCCFTDGFMPLYATLGVGCLQKGGLQEIVT